MTKFIKVEMMETEAVDSFQVSEQFLKNWIDSIEVIDTYVVTDKEVKEFEQLVDSVYATLTHEQKKALFVEALELHTDSSKFNTDTGYCYEVSARKHLEMCVMFSLNDYCEEITA